MVGSKQIYLGRTLIIHVRDSLAFIFLVGFKT
jgi:hypothetical protein